MHSEVSSQRNKQRNSVSCEGAFYKTLRGAQASNLDWLAKESPSKDSCQECSENSFEKSVLVVESVLSLRTN